MASIKKTFFILLTLAFIFSFQQITLAENDVVADTSNTAVISSDATLLSWQLGGQELIGLPGSDPVERYLGSLSAGVIVTADSPDDYLGLQVITNNAQVSKLTVGIFHGYWSTWDMTLLGAAEDLKSFEFSEGDVVVVKVVAEDQQTELWYKAKIITTPYDAPQFLTKFEVGGNNILPLPDLQVGFASRLVSVVNLGANLLVSDYTNFVGIEVETSDQEEFEEKVIYTNSSLDHIWRTYDLNYPGTKEMLLELSLNQNDVVALKLVDTIGNVYWYKVNLLLNNLEKNNQDKLVEESTPILKESPVQIPSLNAIPNKVVRKVVKEEIGTTEELVNSCQLNNGLEYDLYIINPDGTKRHTKTEFVQTEKVSDNVINYGFEDKGADFDYNDLVIQADSNNFDKVIFSRISLNASWHHQVRLALLYNGQIRDDILLWPDSQTAEHKVSVNLNSICRDQFSCKLECLP